MLRLLRSLFARPVAPLPIPARRIEYAAADEATRAAGMAWGGPRYWRG